MEFLVYVFVGLAISSFIAGLIIFIDRKNKVKYPAGEKEKLAQFLSGMILLGAIFWPLYLIALLCFLVWIGLTTLIKAFIPAQ